MMRFKEFVEKILGEDPISIEGVEIGGAYQLLREGKWIDGRYDDNVRIDRDTHFGDVGQDGRHAHVYGRRDRDNALIAVRQNGSSSHGLRGTLHKADADALRQHDFAIRDDNIVEYVVLRSRSDIVLLIESQG